MEISDVRVRLVEDANERLKAVCSITLDGQFVVRDVKIVDGTHGLFVAMPSRKLTVPCSKCRTQNHVRSRCCNECGSRLPPARIPVDENGREKAHRDVAHPITAEFRKTLQDRVLAAFEAEVGDVVEDRVEEAVGTETVEERGVTAEANHGDDECGRGEDHEDQAPTDEVDDESDDDDEVMDGEDEPVSEYDSLIAGLKGGRGSDAAPAGRGSRPDQTRSRGGRPRGPRPVPATAPAATGRNEPDRSDKTDGGQRGTRRGGRGGRGRGGRDEQRPAASQSGGGPSAVARDQPSPKPAVNQAGFVHDEKPEDDDAFGAGMTPKRVVSPPPSRSESAGGRGRGRGGSKPRTETRSRDAEKPPIEPTGGSNVTAQPDPTPPPQTVESVDDDTDGAFGVGIV